MHVAMMEIEATDAHVDLRSNVFGAGLHDNATVGVVGSAGL